MSSGAVLDRVEAIIVGANSSYRRSKQKLTSLLDTDARTLPGIDHSYWVDLTRKRGSKPIIGSLLEISAELTCEFARRWGKGDAQGHDYRTLKAAIEAEVNAIEDSLLYPPNWPGGSSGIVLINRTESDLATATPSDQVLVWVSRFAVTYRQATAHTAV